MASITLAGYAAIVAAGATVVGAVNTSKARREQRRQNAIANRIAANKRMRDIKRAIALSRVRRAELQSQGFQLGVAGGTAVSGSVAAVTSDVAGSIAASNQQFTGQQALTAVSDRISALQSNAATAGAIGAIAGQFTGAQGQQNIAAIKSIAG